MREIFLEYCISWRQWKNTKVEIEIHAFEQLTGPQNCSTYGTNTYTNWITGLEHWKDWGLILDWRASGLTGALGVQIHEAPAASTNFSDILETKQLWKAGQ